MSLRVGVIGCGMVSHAYLGTIARAPGLTLAALASRTRASAEAQARRYGGVATDVDALLDDPAIDLVAVLAPPGVHHALGRQVLEAGKHLYLEKPLATTLADAADLVALADAKGLAIGCAPDTFLGEGQQTARRLVDEGAIGTVTGGAVAFGSPGMEAWHPDPAFFYAAGGGPLLDIGPYYVTALVNLLGPVAAVTAIGSTPRTTRARASGEPIAVAVPTSVAGALSFASGATVSLALSWDVAAHRRPPIELYGNAGTLGAPDPNRFAGAVHLSDDGAWRTIGDDPPPPPAPERIAAAVAALMAGTDPLTGGAVGPETTLRLGDRRGIGLVDLAEAIAAGRAPRASGRLALHVLEVLVGLETSVRDGGRIAIASRVDRPAPLETPA